MSVSQTVAFSELGIDRRSINGDLSGSRNSTMLSLIGDPRGSYTQDCRDPTNREILALITLEDVGPFRVRGLKPAVETLRTICSEIRETEPEVYNAMGSMGMLCCRLVRGSRSSISNHSWGTAIDITLEGKLDKYGDNRTQKGLLKIYKTFNKHGFFWGAAFSKEDSMHFEASEQLIRKWAKENKLTPGRSTFDNGLIDFGDRGSAVEDLQNALNLKLGLDIDVDGIFGLGTRAAVMEFQRVNGLDVDGIVGSKTQAALGL